jgi:hypothetical protein
MKTLTRTIYKAVDGTESESKEKCLKHEQLSDDVSLIMSILSPLPKQKDCSFANGEGFIQHDKYYFDRVKIQLLKLMKKHINSDWIQQSIDNPTIHSSWVGRLLDDYRELEPLRRAWCRISCTDFKYREWGQGYYAEHPEKGTNKQLN